MNGPAITARGPQVAVAWYTEVEEQPRVRLAFSQDGGRSFGDMREVHHGTPLGRVDVDFLDAEQDEVVVSYLATEEGQTGVYVRAARADALGAPTRVATLEGSRADGCPRLVGLERGVLLAWTDREGAQTQVRTALVEIRSE